MTMQNSKLVAAVITSAVLVASGHVVAQEAAVDSPHTVRTTKFTVTDVDECSDFYQKIFEMTEFNRYVVEDFLVEPFVGYNEDARVGLLGFKEKDPAPKSYFPVAVIYTPDLDEVVGRLEQAKHKVQVLAESDAGGQRIAITQDPSGNVLEIIERAGSPAVGGAKLIVDDRRAAEDFFVRVFGVAPGERVVDDSFDVVFMDFAGEMFVALFEAKGVEPLPKSEHPVVAIYTTDFDAVLERVKAEGLGHKEYGTGMFLANDPSGNVVEVVRQRIK